MKMIVVLVVELLELLELLEILALMFLPALKLNGVYTFGNILFSKTLITSCLSQRSSLMSCLCYD